MKEYNITYVNYELSQEENIIEIIAKSLIDLYRKCRDLAEEWDVTITNIEEIKEG